MNLTDSVIVVLDRIQLGMTRQDLSISYAINALDKPPRISSVLPHCAAYLARHLAHDQGPVHAWESVRSFWNRYITEPHEPDSKQPLDRWWMVRCAEYDIAAHADRRLPEQTPVDRDAYLAIARLVSYKSSE